MALIPVDHDPFADGGAGAPPGLIPVDHDPFADDSPLSLAPAAGLPSGGWLDSAARAVTFGLSDAAAAAGGATGLALRRATDSAAASPGASWLGDYQRLLAERTGDQPSLADLSARKQQAIAQQEQQLGRPLTLKERLSAVPPDEDPDLMIALGFALGPEGGAARQGITAYHASAADVPTFSSDYIGTGQGAQTYSRGLYFAGNEAVGKSYLPHDFGPSHADVGQIIQDETGQVPTTEMTNALRGLAYRYNKGNEPLSDLAKLGAMASRDLRGIVPDDQSMLTPFPTIERMIEKTSNLPKPGHMYQVNLDVDPNTLLDWDRPMREQPQPVIDALKQYAKENWIVNPESFPEWTGEDMYNHLIQREIKPEQLRPDAVAQRLRNSGIPGVRYLDAGSRHLGPDDPAASRNYVIFDDKLIDILKKYGLGALIAGGATAIAGNADAATHGIPVDYDPFATAPLPLQ